jgi:phosphoglycerate dehydrogenase-like enzyme
VVNGPYNYMGDGHTESWLRVLEALATLDVAVVAPGHGPCGDASLIADQRAYIASLRAAVAAGIAAGRPLDELERTIEIEERLARYVGSQFEAQVEKIHAEMVGLEMPLELEELGFREAPAIAAGEGRPAPKKLVFSGDPAQVADLERVAGDLEIVLARDNAAVLREVADADALIGRISAEAIRRGTKLRWVHSVSAGVEPYVGIGAPATPGIEELIDSETILTNGQRCYGVAIADQALSYLLALVRQLPTSIAGQRAPAEGTSRWRSVDPGARQEGELRGRTLLVVGVGGIGSQVARRAEAFGMQVLGIDPALDRERPGVDELKGPEALHEFLPRADVVVISCPLTRDTHNLIGARELALLPDGALLINVARGRIVDPAALVDALTSGKLGGAGLDVTEPEPLLDSSPLWDMENVIITPHNAGHADGSRRRVALLIRENVRRFARGLPLLSVVDKKKGY